jgi:MFS family permease
MPSTQENPFEPAQIRQPAGHIRYVVLAWLCALSGILYLDRICISAALGRISEELQISNTGGSFVLMAFTLAYGLFEVPTGRWGDAWGARKVLTRISLWWSVFTVLTGLCNGLTSLIIVRFLFGAGEAGAFPNAARVVSRWFPIHERGRVQGILLAASQTGGAIAPWLAAALIENIGWRLTFAAFGSVGFVWAFGFYFWFRDEPAQHASVNPAELQLIAAGTKFLPAPPSGTLRDWKNNPGAKDSRIHHEPVPPVPWALVFASPSVRMLSAIMVCASFNSYIYFSWFPRYLEKGRGLTPADAGMMTSVVLACAAAGTFFGGWVVDRLQISKYPARSRVAGPTAFLSAAALLASALLCSDHRIAVLLTGGSCFATQATQSLWWSCAIGISGRHTGALFGLMNSAGVFGAMTSQLLVGLLADALGRLNLSGRAQWDPIFYINCLVLLTAAALWLKFVFAPVEGSPDKSS